MVGFKGSKKYQSKLTEKLNHHQSTLASNPQRTSTSSARSVPIDPIDLKGDFFAKDDIEPLAKMDSSAPSARSGVFGLGIGRQGYMPPQEQDTTRHSLEVKRVSRANSPTMLSPRTSIKRGLAESPSGYDNTPITSSASKASSSPRTPKSVSFASPVPEQEHEMMPLSPKSPGAALHHETKPALASPRLAVHTQSDSYFFENDYNVSQTPNTDNVQHHDAKMDEIVHKPYEERGSYLDEDDPISDYYGRASYEEAPAYSSNYDAPSTIQSLQPENHEEVHDEATLLHRDEAISPTKTDRFGSIAAVIPKLKREKTSDKYTSAYRHNVLADQLAAMTYAAKPPASIRSNISKGSSSRNEKNYADDDTYAGLPLHQKGLRTARRWYGNWSTRKIIIAVVAFILVVFIAIGTALGVIFGKQDVKAGLTPTWRPAPGTTWNIQLQTPIIQKPNSAAHVYDIDLFDNSAANIAMLHSMGRKVICYFSAGTYESWRPDAKKFPTATIGRNVSGWAGENWVDIRNKDVQAIMHARIDLAIQKGCDGVDPDNVNIYSQTDSGFPLTLQNGIDFMNDLASYAHTSSIAIGLKNAPELINGTLSNLDWVITESCVPYDECAPYDIFITVGKPVLHIEYSETGMNATALKQACTAPNTHGFSTILKKSKLDHWNVACPVGDSAYYDAEEAEL